MVPSAFCFAGKSTVVLGAPGRGDLWLARFECRIGQLVVLVEFRLIVNRIG